MSMDDQSAVGTWDRYLTDAPDPNELTVRTNYRLYARRMAERVGLTVDEWIDRTYPPEHREFMRTAARRGR